LSGVSNTSLILFFILLFLFVRHYDAVSNYLKFAQELRVEKIYDGHQQKSWKASLPMTFQLSCSILIAKRQQHL